MMNTVMAAAMILTLSGAWHGNGGGRAVEREPLLRGGMFLVASPNMADPRFQRTVILLADHGGPGVMGLIINRPTALDLTQLFPDFKGTAGVDSAMHYGGPVSRFLFTMLIRSGEKPPPGNAARVFDGVYFTADLSTLFELPAAKNLYARGYLGYAGWGPGQLEAELERGDWVLAPAKAEMVFRSAHETVWNELIEAYGGARWVFPAFRVPSMAANARGR
ncbi:MAG: YqgE/AlgH family protein [Nitrospinae bacterium]|nr:YqgE/AlgH family protein [Nitrospinota bacterium]